MNRVFAINVDSSDARNLGQRDNMFRVNRQFDGFVVDWLPEEDDWVMMSRYHSPERNRGDTRIVDTDEGLGLLRINTVTGRTQRILRPVRQNVHFLSDGHGTVRIKATIATRGATGMYRDTINYYYRTADSDEWREFGSHDFVNEVGLYPLAVDRDLDAVYGIDRHDGRDAVFRIALNDTLDRELIYAHPEVDVNRLIRLGRSRRVIGVGYSEDENEVHYFDAEYEALHQALRNALPGNPEIIFLDASDDESRLLIRTVSESNPGRYYIFHRSAGALNEILLARPELENVALGEVRPVRYPAADGTMIPGYLTLPPGSSGQGLPCLLYTSDAADDVSTV